MAENLFESDDTGSSIASGVPNANDLGQTPAEKTAPAVDPEQHKELESLVGRQGQELGEYRKFFTEIAPLLDKLDKSPEMVQAIVDGKITPELAKAAIEGKISVEDAETVTKAAETEVKKDLGKKGLSETSPEDVAKLIEEKAKELKSDFDAKLKERDELNAFEASVNDFISRTSDFAQYAKEIDKWLDEHDVTDIAVAYYAVKGEISEKEARKQAEREQAEAEKSGALNMGGGNSGAQRIRGDVNVIDNLISSKSNPNIFG